MSPIGLNTYLHAANRLRCGMAIAMDATIVEAYLARVDCKRCLDSGVAPLGEAVLSPVYDDSCSCSKGRDRHETRNDPEPIGDGVLVDAAAARESWELGRAEDLDARFNDYEPESDFPIQRPYL